jgi:uncharacterized membrane protein
VLGERRVPAVTAGGIADDADGEPSGGPAAAARAVPTPADPGAPGSDAADSAPAEVIAAAQSSAAQSSAAQSPAGPSGSVWRDPVLWVITAAVFGAYFVISLFKLLRLAPDSWDLGIFTEYVKQLSLLQAPVVDIRGPGFNLLGDHFTIGLAVLAPFFRVFPSPATLLFFQAAACAVSVFPVAAAGTAFTGRTTGRLIGFAYGFSWGLQQMIDFDFHEIALAVPLLAFSLSALVRRRPAAAIAWAVPLVFVKEDQGFTVAAIGLLMGVTAAFPPDLARGWRSRLPLAGGAGRPGGGRRSGDRWGDGRTALWGGVFLMAWGLFWSLLAIIVIIPHFNPLHEYYYWNDGGVVGGNQSFSIGGLLGQTATGWPTKLETVVLLLLPTAFAALGSPVTLVALPSLALRFMSTNTAYWGTDWHYNATLMPILFIAAAEAIGRMRGDPALAASLEAGPPGTGPAGAGLTGARRTGARRTGAGLTGAGFTGGPLSGARRAWRVLLPGLPGAVRAAGRPVRPAGGAVRQAARPARIGIARHGPAMMAAVTVALAFQFPLNSLWQSSTYQLSAHVAAADAAMAVVPDGATVVTNLDLLAPLAARTDTFWLGNAGNPLTQYIVFDGVDSGYVPNVSDVPRFIASYYPDDGYVQVFERDDVYVYQRR